MDVEFNFYEEKEWHRKSFGVKGFYESKEAHGIHPDVGDDLQDIQEYVLETLDELGIPLGREDRVTLRSLPRSRLGAEVKKIPDDDLDLLVLELSEAMPGVTFFRID